MATLVDSATPVDEFESLLKAMEDSGADMVVLSRLPTDDNRHLRVIRDFAGRFEVS